MIFSHYTFYIIPYYYRNPHTSFKNKGLNNKIEILPELTITQNGQNVLKDGHILHLKKAAFFNK